MFNLYVSELYNFQETRLSLCEQKQAFLRHGNFSDTVRGLDTRGQLVNTFAVIKAADDLREEVDILRFSLCLLQEGVKRSKDLWVHLCMLFCNKDNVCCQGRIITKFNKTI